jgi:hypothetical protein
MTHPKPASVARQKAARGVRMSHLLSLVRATLPAQDFRLGESFAHQNASGTLARSFALD